MGEVGLRWEELALRDPAFGGAGSTWPPAGTADTVEFPSGMGPVFMLLKGHSGAEAQHGWTQRGLVGRDGSSARATICMSWSPPTSMS